MNVSAATVVVPATYKNVPVESTAMNAGIASPRTSNGESLSSVKAPVTGSTANAETLFSPELTAYKKRPEG